ncbi:uncharacterized protein ACJ7VT_022909 isoform 2-T2 [Polymixia lowei]
MTSRQHVSFGTTRRSREEPQVNMETRPQIMKVGQAGLGCRGSPKKSGDLRPPHQSAACSKTWGGLGCGASLKTSAHHTCMQQD